MSQLAAICPEFGLFAAGGTRAKKALKKALRSAAREGEPAALTELCPRTGSEEAKTRDEAVRALVT